MDGSKGTQGAPGANTAALPAWVLGPMRMLVERMAKRSEVSFEITWPDGSTVRLGDAKPAFWCTLRTYRAVLALGLHDEMAVGEAFLRGDIEIEGDFVSALRLRSSLGDVALLDHLRQTYWQPWFHGQTRQDQRWIEAHYDEVPDFYLAFLDERHRCYSHGYFASADEPLEDAISRKLTTALDSLAVRPGARILDIGAGWGAFNEFAGARGYRVVSLTLSGPSESYVQGVIDRKGLDCEVRRCHLLEFEDPQGFDGIVNLGVTEHLPDYARTLQVYDRLLAPGGRVFLDACSSRTKFPFSSFVKRHVWPGNATPLVFHEYAAAVADSAFDILSVAEDRMSYALTARAWARKLEASRASLVARFGEAKFRRFQLYLWGCVHGFETRSLGACHLLLQKPLDGARHTLARHAWARLPAVFR